MNFDNSIDTTNKKRIDNGDGTFSVYDERRKTWVKEISFATLLAMTGHTEEDLDPAGLKEKSSKLANS